MRNKKQLQDYFNEVDEATDCEEPRAKTVNLYRLYFVKDKTGFTDYSE